MKRVASLLLAAALTFSAACSSSDEQIPPAGLAETYDLVLAGDLERGDLVFVTSAETDDLRVIDPANTDYIRAPNPLEALSIPVVPRPDKLARDVSYAAPVPGKNQSDEVTGPYVYVRSASEPVISVVSTKLLREVARVTAVGAVTAFAARGPTQLNGPSELYFATQLQGRSSLYRVVLPSAPEELERLSKASDPSLTPVSLPIVARDPAVLPVPAEGYGPVVSLLVLPDGQLAMATRAFRGAVVRDFATVRLRLEAAQATLEAKLDFTIPTSVSVTADRRPVGMRYLMTHGTVPAGLTAGQRIYGLIDEESCVGLPRCGGVLAVESATGAISQATVAAVPDVKDNSGNITVPGTPAVSAPMIPLAFDSSLPTGLTLAPGARLAFATNGSDVYPLVGAVGHASGNYMLFDALNLVHLDRDPDKSTVVFNGVVSATGNTRAATDPVVVNNPTVVETREGYAENHTVSLVYEGLIGPGVHEIGGTPEAPVFKLPPTLSYNVDPTNPASTETPDVQEGDFVLFFTGTNVTTICPVATPVPVASVTPGSLATNTEITLTLGGDGLVPEPCRATARFFQVIAGGGTNRPFAAFSDGAYLGRPFQPAIVNGVPKYFEVRTPARYLGPGFATQDGLQMRIYLRSTAVGGTNRGDQYVYAMSAEFDPFSFGVDTNVSRLGRYFIPGPMVYSPGVQTPVVGTDEFENKGGNRLYVVYPNADGVLQVALQLVHNNTAEGLPMVPFQ